MDLFLVRITSDGGCDLLLDFELDCCPLEPTEIQCSDAPHGDLQPPIVWWPEMCGTAWYELEIQGDNGCIESFILDNPDPFGQYFFGVGSASLCVDGGYTIRVRGFCTSTGDFGSWSNTLLFYGKDCYGNSERDSSNDNEQIPQTDLTIVQQLDSDVNVFPNPGRSDGVHIAIPSNLYAEHSEIYFKLA